MNSWRVAFRSLRRRPAYALVMVLMLSLGLGVTTALFSVVHTVLLKPLPYPQADRLVTVLEASPALNKKESLIAPARLEDWNRLNQTFEVIAAAYAENVTDTSAAEPERLAGRRVSPRYFAVWRTSPLLGHTFTSAEDLFGGPNVAVISYGLWTRRFGLDRGVLGKQLVLGGQSYAIVGVMPREFAAPSIDLWLPAHLAPGLMRVREARFYGGVARMKPGVTVEQAQADLARVQHQLGEQFPGSDKDWSAMVRDLKEVRVGDYRRNLLLLLGAVAALLLIAVINMAGLQLAQLHQRQRDLAIRSSIGASRTQVVAAVLREILLLALGGAAIGTALASALVAAVPSEFPDLPRILELSFDWRPAVFAAAVSLAAAAIFGVLPAWQVTRRNLAPMVAESAPSISGGRRTLQAGLVVAQLALTVVLLAGAGLLLRSYRNLSRVELGFDTVNTVTFHVGAAWDEDRPRVGRMQLDILSALERFPGVTAAGMTNFLPSTGATLNFQVVVGGMAQNQENGTFTVGERTVDAGYLRTLKIPLLAGSYCSDLPPVNTPGAPPPTAMLNRRFVDVYAHGQSVIGRHLRFAQDPPNAPGMEITGVVGDAREDGLAQTPAPYVYVCLPPGSWPDPEYVVGSRGDARALLPEIASIVHGVAPNRAVFGIKMLDSLVDDALEQPRLNTSLLSAFAGAAMLLAAVGLYGLMALVVSAQTREIGIRMALGARRTQIMGLIMRRTGRLLALGVLLGLGLGFAVERLLKSLLFGVDPLDAWSLAGAVALLCLVSAAAAALPARRAAAIDPIDAIRTP